MHIAILGCGYVGLALADLLESHHEVTGLRRSEEGIEAIRAVGCRAVRADVTDRSQLDAVPDPDVVVFTASAGGRGHESATETYIEGQQTAIEAFCERTDSPSRYIYTGSTGVYGDHDGAWVDEETPLDPTTRRQELLAEAEQIALDKPATHGVDGTVVRFAGLYGPDRHRIDRYLDGPVTDRYLNLLHRDDAAGVLAHLIENDCARDEVVVAVDSEPVSKRELASWLADSCGVPEPPAQTVEQRLDTDDLSPAARQRIAANKRCSNAKLRELGYEFSFPTFREGYQAGIDAYLAEHDG